MHIRFVKAAGGQADDAAGEAVILHLRNHFTVDQRTDLRSLGEDADAVDRADALVHVGANSSAMCHTERSEVSCSATQDASLRSA
jgi:hypothetical protein